MNAEYVNVVIQSVTSVLKSVCSETADIGKVEFVTNNDDFHDFNVYIGVIYDVKASVVFSGSDKVGLFIASKMIMAEVTEWSEIAISALKELTNMMAGTCSIKFSQFSQNTDITVPNFQKDKNRENTEKLLMENLSIRIPFSLSEGRVFYVTIQFLENY